MKILVVLGGSLAGESLSAALKSAIPEKALPGHEVMVVSPQEAINGYFALNPEGIIFAGLHKFDKDKGVDETNLVRSMLLAALRGSNTKCLFATPLLATAKLSGLEGAENLFRLDDWAGMKAWFGIE